MFEVDNRIDIIDLKWRTSIAFIQNGLVLETFTYDSTRSSLRNLKKILKHLKKHYNFKFARIEIKRDDKNTSKIIKNIKMNGIVITKIIETKI